jgi:ectoine hydroxylase-related dioxygenase (phytanoyl-CoA dioxygenase family)
VTLPAASAGLTSEQVRFFWENGYLTLGRILDEAALDQLRRHAEWISRGEAAHVPARQLQVEPLVTAGKVGAERFDLSLRKLHHLAWYDTDMLAHAQRPEITARIASLLGPDLKLYQDQLFMKPPGIGSRQKYHQDQPLGFHIEPPDRMVTCWLALDDSTVENGCLRVLPGSHLRGALSREEVVAVENAATDGSLEGEVALELRAGECSFHHGHVLHCSYANTSGKQRRGYATHYVSARCRYVGPPTEEGFPLVAGVSHPGGL